MVFCVHTTVARTCSSSCYPSFLIMWVGWSAVWAVVFNATTSRQFSRWPIAARWRKSSQIRVPVRRSSLLSSSGWGNGTTRCHESLRWVICSLGCVKVEYPVNLSAFFAPDLIFACITNKSLWYYSNPQFLYHLMSISKGWHTCGPIAQAFFCYLF